MPQPISRRDLLLGLTGSVWLIGSQSASAADKPARKFTMDLVCHNIGVDPPLPEAISLAAKHGFESVAPDAGYLKSLPTGRFGALTDELRDRKLVWGAADLLTDFRGAEQSFLSGMKSLPAEANALREVGASRMSTWIAPAHDRLTYRENFHQHVRRLREIARVLHDHGIRLGLEYVGPKTSWSSKRYPFIHTMAEARELVAAIDVPGVGLVLDSWHWYTAHEKPADVLALRGSEVVACDLNDAPRDIPVDQQRDLVRDLPCATGVIDLKSFLEALVAIGYDGPVRAEPFKAELRKRSLDDAVGATATAMRRAFGLIPDA
ncbi:MAG: sugar phosphate isomerase/epimerase [Isosphaeraceae bacterium]